MTLTHPNSVSSEGYETKPVQYLVPERIACADGMGPVIDVGTDRGKLLVVTLAITDALEKESLIVFISGSTDRTNWDNKPLVSFTPKHYCGIYSILLNLAKNPEVQHIRAEWKMSRWRKGDASPMFGFYVSVQQSGSRVRMTAL